MIHKGVAAVAAIGLLCCATPAQAGVYSDNLSKCLVASSSDEDQIAFIRWIFSVMAANPKVAGYANIKPEQRTAFNKDAATLFQRLMLKDCRTETAQAIKYEGGSAIEAAFGTLGQAAMRGLMNDPKVTLELNELQKSTDEAQWEAFAKENGISSPSKKRD
ncbi:MAG TPA: hypothetical protein VF459_04150 [Caulobacteraceae bacterium]